jgi:hypothetical protein
LSSLCTLIVFKPKNFVLKAKDGILIIFEKTKDKSKMIKLAEINYEEIEDFIFEEERIKITFYKGT